jgi:acetyl-CoA/propionyl-CoA carboxylase biotin carboxyl carrier protein
MFTTVLVANRGEIACRIIETLLRMGIRSVAVYSDADRDARHVTLADVAVRIGPAAPQQSYLNVAAILDAAKRAGADAIHPGYGFLSENAEFARACAADGVVFIGPEPQAIDIMGDKIRAKEHVSARGVPVIAGAGTAGMSDADLVEASATVGFPLLIKPSAGGGGKGMTVVESAEDLPAALASTRRVALSAFGDDTLLLERYLPEPRHIEVQVLADSHGTVIHLGERECSLQRRHQKIIEEAPSPLLDAAARARMGEAACEVARSVDYRGAGTIEFLVSASAPDEFFFMEMNTRLQVEHPVTEMVTGLDLVESQLSIAAGEPLGLAQDDIVLTGHAIEARLYAEDPARGFLPATGSILVLDEPTGDGIRVDSSLADGLVIEATYDPMLAKIIAHGDTRAEALLRLDGALASTVVLGVRTNLEFLRALLADEDVRAGRLDTGLIARLVDGIQTAAWRAAPVGAVMFVTAALAEHSRLWRAGSPWRQPNGWRVGAHRAARYSFRLGVDETADVLVSGPVDDATVVVRDGPELAARMTVAGHTARLELDGETHVVAFARTGEHPSSGDHFWIGTPESVHDLQLRDRSHQLADHRATLTRVAGTAAPEVRTPMPGTVVTVTAASGDTVEPGQLLLTVEAMKMEHKMLASIAGVVTIDVVPGDLVSLDQVVARINPHEGEPHEP